MENPYPGFVTTEEVLRRLQAVENAWLTDPNPITMDAARKLAQLRFGMAPNNVASVGHLYRKMFPDGLQ